MSHVKQADVRVKKVTYIVNTHHHTQMHREGERERETKVIELTNFN